MDKKRYSYLLISLLLFSCGSGTDEQAIERMQKGSAFLNNKNYTGALSEFKSALNFELSNEAKTVNYRNIAVAFLFMGQEDSAKHYSKLGMQVAKKNSFYYLLHQAEYDLLNQKIDRAIRTFHKAQELKPDEMEIHNNLSLIYAGNYGEKFMNLDKALLHAEKAYQLKKNEINQEQLASVYFQRDNFEKAAALFLDLKNKHPESKIYQFYYGQSIYFQGSEEKGLELMKDAADRDEKCRILFEELIS